MIATEERTTTMTVETELRQQLANLPAPVARILTPEQYTIACEAVAVRKSFIKEAKAKLDPICESAHRTWKAATGLRASIVDPVEQEITKIGAAIIEYDNEQRRLAEEAERLKAEAARKAEEEAQKANDALLPWEEDQAVDVVEAVQRAVETVQQRVPQVQVPRAVAGVTTKAKPWKARVTDMKKFLAFVIEKERFELVTPDMTALNQMARKMTTTMVDAIPGTEAYQERTIATR